MEGTTTRDCGLTDTDPLGLASSSLAFIEINSDFLRPDYYRKVVQEAVAFGSAEYTGSVLESAPEATAQESAWRHGRWAEERNRICKALGDSEQSATRVWRFANCGSAARLEWSPTLKEARVKSWHCHDRFCQPCAAVRSTAARKALLTLTQGRQCYMGTFTQQADRSGLSVRINRLGAAFNRLRETKIWREQVIGGASAIEVKIGSGSGDWHPHYHVLLEAQNLSYGKVLSAWRKASGGLGHGRIRQVRDTSGGVAYVTKYVTKPLDGSVTENDYLLAAAIVGMHRRRMLATFGGWRGTRLQALVPRASDWQDRGSLHQIICDAAGGNETALRMLRAVRSSVDREQAVAFFA